MSTNCPSVMLLLFRTFTLCFSHSLLQLGDGRIETETRNYILRVSALLPPFANHFSFSLLLQLADGIGLRRRRVTISLFAIDCECICLLSSLTAHHSLSLF
jgi:hypothetical protein